MKKLFILTLFGLLLSSPIVANKRTATSSNSGITEISSADFNSQMHRIGNKIIKFYDPNCPHCKAAKRPFEQLATEINNASFYAVDVVKNPDLAEKYTITGLPTFVILDRENKVIDKVQFSNKSQLKKDLNKALKNK